MGLITQVLTLPLAPLHGSLWAIDQVVLAAQRECRSSTPSPPTTRRRGEWPPRSRGGGGHDRGPLPPTHRR